MDLKGKKVLDTDCTGENCESQEYNKAGNVLGVAASKNNKMLYFQSKTAIKKKEMEREVQKKKKHSAAAGHQFHCWDQDR